MIKGVIEKMIEKQLSGLKKQFAKATPEQRKKAIEKLKEDSKKNPYYKMAPDVFEKIFKELEDENDFKKTKQKR